VVQSASAPPAFRIPKGIPVTLSDPPMVPQWLLLLERYVHKQFFGGFGACCTSRRSRSRPLNVPLISRASQVFTLQLLIQALAFAALVRTSLTLQPLLLCEALECSLHLQGQVLSH